MRNGFEESGLSHFMYFNLYTVYCKYTQVALPHIP